jgi:type I restriction enzyme S subunit
MPPLGEQKRLAAILDQADSLMRERRRSLALLAKLPRAVFAARFLNCHWPQLPLAEVVKEDDRINYGVIQPGGESGTGIPLVRAANVADQDFDTHRLKRIAPDIESSYKRSRLHGDEVLVVCVGVSIGSIAIAPKALAGANIARAVARVRVDNRKADPIYIAHFLRLDRSQNYFASETRTVAQPTLNIKQLSETPVLVPPLEL